MKARTTLVKALHTVTTVSRLAAHLIDTTRPDASPELAVRAALAVIGQSGPYAPEDSVLVACIAATRKITGSN